MGEDGFWDSGYELVTGVAEVSVTEIEWIWIVLGILDPTCQISLLLIRKNHCTSGGVVSAVFRSFVSI